MYRVDQALIERHTTHVALRLFKKIRIGGDHLVDDARHQASGRLDAGGVLPPDVLHPKAICFKRLFGRSRAHEHFRSALVLACTIDVHRNTQFLKRTAPIQTGTRKALEHHAAHRVHENFVGVCGYRVLNLTVARRPNGDLLAGGLDTIHRRTDFAQGSQPSLLQILHAEVHRRDALVVSRKRQSARHISQTRKRIRTVDHGGKRSLAVEIVFFDNLPRQGHQQHGIVGHAHGLFVEKSKNNRAENQQKDQVQGQTPQKIQPAPASLQHLQHLRLSCLNLVSCRPASERYARDGPAQTGNRLQRQPRRAPARDAVRAYDSPRTKPSPCRVSWPS